VSLLEAQQKHQADEKQIRASQEESFKFCQKLIL
jgi:hypothetical protein